MATFILEKLSLISLQITLTEHEIVSPFVHSTHAESKMMMLSSSLNRFPSLLMETWYPLATTLSTVVLSDLFFLLLVGKLQNIWINVSNSPSTSTVPSSDKLLLLSTLNCKPKLCTFTAESVCKVRTSWCHFYSPQNDCVLTFILKFYKIAAFHSYLRKAKSKY